MSTQTPNQIFEEQLLVLGSGEFDDLAQITRAITQPHLRLGASKCPMQLLLDHWNDVESNLGDDSFVLEGEDPEEDGYWSLNSLVMGHFVRITGPSMEDADGNMVDWLEPYIDAVGVNSDYFDSIGSEPAVGCAFLEFYEDRQIEARTFLQMRSWIKSDSDLPKLKSFLDSCESDSKQFYSTNNSKLVNIDGWVSFFNHLNDDVARVKLIDRLESQGLDLSKEFDTTIHTTEKSAPVKCNALGYALATGNEVVALHLASKGMTLDQGLIAGVSTDSLEKAMSAADLTHNIQSQGIEAKLRSMENAARAQEIMVGIKNDLGLKR